ncbi:MAG TPA: long-chain fatty acid--CoA ligase [Hypericibacter adhaerens]|uniref:long-chain-fatty-acid--CoA ligase n=1 Tax=Hypericibacter adhaerens TaxID=2602016 RepID=UPI002BA14901|nr:long-chain fatty acid--CoA ligase [Hypericibacter adhaerens]HWA42759.1 long-chain fatty acid--CoA ligase [Hypericibacter adhaerens]
MTASLVSPSIEPAPRWLTSYPADVDWNAAIEPQPVYALLDHAVATWPERVALNFMGRRTSYAELGRLVDRAAVGLAALGVGPGVKLGLFLPNCPYFVVLYYAALKTGATVVNFNPLYTPTEVTRQVEDSETDVMATLDLAMLYNKLGPLLDSTRLKRLIVCPMADLLPTPKRWFYQIAMRRTLADPPRDDRHTRFADLVENGGGFSPPTIDPSRQLALLQYTGGTTGIPKGAMLTHANVYINAEQCRLWFPVGNGADAPPEIMLGVLPLFHVFAMTVVMNWSIRVGAEIVLLPRFELKGMLQTIGKRKPTVFAGVPTLFNAIVNHPKIASFHLDSLRFCISGGAPLPDELRARFERLSSARLVEGYGLSETSPVVCCNPPFEGGRAGSVGLPYPRTVIEIRDAEPPHRLLAQGERGEICVRGPQVMAGYWKRPDETATSFVEGAFRTGDVGYIDADGYVFITDRLKDMINASGYKVYPRLIEEAIYRHPDVADCAVIGMPDPYRGQTVKAVIVAKPGTALTDKILIAFLKDKLSPIEMPTAFEFRASLPKTAVGKIDKKVLQAEATERKPA